MVTIHFEDDQKTVEAAPNQSLTDICDEHPTSILFGCRNAVCGTCVIEVSQGFENLSPITADEQDLLDVLAPDHSNARLACQCVVEQGSVSLHCLKN
jgi:ferredoxin